MYLNLEGTESTLKRMIDLCLDEELTVWAVVGWLLVVVRIF